MNKCRCFNQKRYEQLIELMRNEKMFMRSLNFYEFQLLRRERFRFLEPEKYKEINGEI